MNITNTKIIWLVHEDDQASIIFRYLLTSMESDAIYQLVLGYAQVQITDAHKFTFQAGKPGVEIVERCTLRKDVFQNISE